MATITRTNGGTVQIGQSGQTLVTGRALSHYTVSLSGVHIGYSSANSDFEVLVRALAKVSSVELLGTPAAGAFRIALTGAENFGNTDLEAIANAAVRANGSVLSGATVISYTY